MQHLRNANKHGQPANKHGQQHLSRNPDQCVLQVNGAKLKQLEKFKYLEVAFTSDRRQDKELDTRIG